MAFLLTYLSVILITLVKEALTHSPVGFISHPSYIFPAPPRSTTTTTTPSTRTPRTPAPRTRTTPTTTTTRTTTQTISSLPSGFPQPSTTITTTSSSTSTLIKTAPVPVSQHQPSLPSTCTTNFNAYFSIFQSILRPGSTPAPAFRGFYRLQNSALGNMDYEFLYVDSKTSILGRTSLQHIDNPYHASPWAFCQNYSIGFGDSTIFQICPNGRYRSISNGFPRKDCEDIVLLARNLTKFDTKSAGSSNPPGSSNSPAPSNSPGSSNSPGFRNANSSSGVPSWIAAPIVVGVVLIIALLCGFLWWRARSDQSTTKAPDTLETGVKPKAELEAKSLPPPSELPETIPAKELQGDPKLQASEMEGNNTFLAVPTASSRASSQSHTQVQELSSHNSQRD